MASLALALTLSPLPSPPSPPLPSPSPSRTPPPSPSSGVSTAAARCTRAAGSRASRTARARSHSCRKRSSRHDWVFWRGRRCVWWEEGARGVFPQGRVPGMRTHFEVEVRLCGAVYIGESVCVLLVSVKPCTTCYDFCTINARCAVPGTGHRARPPTLQRLKCSVHSAAQCNTWFPHKEYHNTILYITPAQSATATHSSVA